MKNIYLITLGLAVFILVGSGLAFAMSCHDTPSGDDGHSKAQNADLAAKSEVIDVGNKICPVTGEKIDKDVGEGFKPSPTYEYEGKIYNFCCAGCIEEFKKEPQKYIDKVNQELQDNQNTE